LGSILKKIVEKIHQKFIFKPLFFTMPPSLAISAPTMQPFRLKSPRIAPPSPTLQQAMEDLEKFSAKLRADPVRARKFLVKYGFIEPDGSLGKRYR
jgi:hypothetical protein